MKCPFDLTNKKQIIEFEEKDPYNPQNVVKGYINRRQGILYGSLYITHVNGKKCYQMIYSAPKQHYPFDRDDKADDGRSNWEFPKCDVIEVYTKLDGTCIISYIYKDVNNQEYLTYKTRLRPFLGESRYGNFFQLWNEMRERYPEIDELCWRLGKHWNIICELYGKRNKVLIDYDVSLDMRIIFAIEDGKVIPALDVPTSILPLVDRYGTIIPEDLSPTIYIEMEDKLEIELDIDDENKIMKGNGDGTVWYFMEDGFAKLIKCKPPSVRKKHWAEDAISYESIYTTCINAFENFDEPTYDDIVRLLQEEFDDDKIEKSRVRIDKILGRVLFDKKLQYEVVEKYNKLGIDINDDKGSVMRYFAKEYPKDQSQRIFTLLNAYVNVKKE